MSPPRRSPPLLAALWLWLAGCPEPGQTDGDLSADPATADPQDGAGGGPGGPSPHSNPNDARFTVAPGEGVKIQGTFQYAGESAGSYRIDFQKQEGNAPPTLVHAIELDQPGEFSVEVPRGYGPVMLTGFVDVRGDGPSADDPIGRTAEPIVVGEADITGVVLDVAVGNDLARPAPPQPGQAPAAGDPADAGRGSNGQPTPPPDGGTPPQPPPTAPPPSDLPPADG